MAETNRRRGTRRGRCQETAPRYRTPLQKKDLGTVRPEGPDGLCTDSRLFSLLHRKSLRVNRQPNSYIHVSMLPCHYCKYLCRMHTDCQGASRIDGFTPSPSPYIPLSFACLPAGRLGLGVQAPLPLGRRATLYLSSLHFTSQGLYLSLSLSFGRAEARADPLSRRVSAPPTVSGKPGVKSS